MYIETLYIVNDKDSQKTHERVVQLQLFLYIIDEVLRFNRLNEVIVYFYVVFIDTIVIIVIGRSLFRNDITIYMFSLNFRKRGDELVSL